MLAVVAVALINHERHKGYHERKPRFVFVHHRGLCRFIALCSSEKGNQSPGPIIKSICAPRRLQKMSEMTIAPVATHGFFLDGRWLEDGDIIEIHAPL